MKDLHDMVEEHRITSPLDSEIGDGDHGINLSIGFRAVIDKLEEMMQKQMIFLLKKGGHDAPWQAACISPYGAFMKLGDDVKGKIVTFEEFCGWSLMVSRLFARKRNWR